MFSRIQKGIRPCQHELHFQPSLLLCTLKMVQELVTHLLQVENGLSVRVREEKPLCDIAFHA